MFADIQSIEFAGHFRIYQHTYDIGYCLLKKLEYIITINRCSLTLNCYDRPCFFSDLSLTRHLFTV